MPSVSRTRWHGKNTEILLPVEGENCMAKAQMELVLRELWGTIKRDFLNKIMVVGSAKIPLA